MLSPRRSSPALIASSLAVLALAAAAPVAAETQIRLVPPDGTVLAAGQRFDIRAEATAADPASPPRDLRLLLDGRDVTGQAQTAPGPEGTVNLLLRDHALEREGAHVLEARTADGARATVSLTVAGWQAGAGVDPARPRARNVILFLGDGMGAAHRSAARVVSRGVRNGRAAGLLAMDTMPVTGQVMTYALNAVITDSAPGMASYVTGSNSNNNQEGVYPDNTLDPFDNPRIEYLGELLRRTRGPGFRVGIVTTANVTDATPAANAVHTANRNAWAEIAARFLDERDRNAVSVLLGGGARAFRAASREDGRDLAAEFEAAGFQLLSTGTDVQELLEGDEVPAELLGLFHPSHLSVAFDRVGRGRYSDELDAEENAALRDQPGLPEMTRLALRSLSSHADDGFYLMVEAASIDKQAHRADAERSLWDVIELDEAVAEALAFAERTNSDEDPANDTLVIVTADHETGGLALVGVGNERYAPRALGRAVRDYAAVYRFEPEQLLDFVTNYETDARGYPVDPDPSRKLLLGWAAAPDRWENWISNRRPGWPATPAGARGFTEAVANSDRDATGRSSENRTVDGVPIPGFPVPGVIENGATPCPSHDGCPGDTASSAQLQSGHTATDVPLSAAGPGALQFTGTYDNTEVFVKILRATTGAWEAPR